LERGAGETDFQGGGIGRVADEGIAKDEGGPVGGAPDGYTETAAAGPTEVHQQRVQAGFEHAEGHAKARMTIPRHVSESRNSRTKASACGLSPWTQRVRTPLSRISNSACRTASAG